MEATLKTVTTIIICLVIYRCDDFVVQEISDISCYSKGKLTYKSKSVGFVHTLNDHIYFQEKSSGNMMTVYGDCIVRRLSVDK